MDSKESTGTAEGLEAAVLDLKKHAQEGNFDRVENLWLQAVEKGVGLRERVGDFLDVAERFISDERKRDRLGTLLEFLLSSLSPAEGEPPSPPLLRLYRLLVYCLPEKSEYVQAFSEAYEQLYPAASAERVFYEVCAPAASVDPAAALRRLENLLKFREGAYVYHRSGWGVGKVVAVDPFLKQVKVDLEGKQGHRIAIDVVDSILSPLDPGSFHALRYEGGAELRRLRDEDPVRLVDLVFEAFGRELTLKEIRGYLVPTVVPADGWIRWWNRAKGFLRETGLYRIGDRAPHLVQRLEQAVSYEADLIEEFHRADWARARQIARQVSKHPGSPAWVRIEEKLQKVVEAADFPRSLEAALILDRASKGSANLERVLSGLAPAALVSVLAKLAGAEDERRAVERLPEARPADWEGIAEELVLGAKEALAEAAWDALGQRSPARLDRIVRDVVASPMSAPDAFCMFLAESAREPARAGLSVLAEKSPRDLLVLVLDFLEHLQHAGGRHGRTAVKGRVRKVLDFVLAKEARVFRAGLEGMALEERREVHQRIVRNESIPPYGKGELLTILAEYEPSLDRRSAQPPWEEEGTVYVTAAGRAKREAEFRELMETKLPKVFEEIGKALGFGDVSENAEYTAALEERDKLAKRASAMKEELKRAKLIEPASVPPGVVGLGSRVRVRSRRTGEEHAYSILGPWDGTPEEGVLSYLSPLARLFFGRAPGDVVEADLPGGKEVYEILEVTSHFAPES